MQATKIEDLNFKINANNPQKLMTKLQKGAGEMKTWEVYKIALENPKAKFKRIDKLRNELIYHFEGGVPMCKCRGHIFESSDLMNANYDWELVREPVDFMTAINSGKKIKPEIYDLYHDLDFIFSALIMEKPSTVKRMINGNWYIE